VRAGLRVRVGGVGLDGSKLEGLELEGLALEGLVLEGLVLAGEMLDGDGRWMLVGLEIGLGAGTGLHRMKGKSMGERWGQGLGAGKMSLAEGAV
jgi:hypothetical protein